MKLSWCCLPSYVLAASLLFSSCTTKNKKPLVNSIETNSAGDTTIVPPKISSQEAIELKAIDIEVLSTELKGPPPLPDTLLQTYVDIHEVGVVGDTGWVCSSIQCAQDSNFFKEFVWSELHAALILKHNDFFIRHLNFYTLGVLSTQIGTREELTVIEPYFYCTIIKDGNIKKWNKIDWNNNAVFGFGFRKRLNFSRLFPGKYRDYLFIDIFAENAWIKYFPDNIFYLEHRPNNDYKFGVALEGKFYTQFVKLSNSKIQIRLAQFSFWGSTYYSKSSFYSRFHNGFYLSTFAFNVGPYLRFSKISNSHIYFSSKLIYDHGENYWNSLDWHNNLKYGPGIDFCVVESEYYKKKSSNAKIRFFGELQWIRWAKKVQYIPSYRPAWDVQVGLIISWAN